MRAFLVLLAAFSPVHATSRAAPAPLVVPSLASLEIVQTFKQGVFLLQGPEGEFVLKATAMEHEGAVQRRAGELLREAGVVDVSVPRVLAEYELFDVPKGTPPAILKARPANRRLLLMERAPGRSLHESRAALSSDEHERLDSAVRVLHEGGVAHGDVDPLNVLRSGEGDKTRLHLIDWEFGSMRGYARKKLSELRRVEQLLFAK